MTSILIPIGVHRFLITSSPESFHSISYYHDILIANKINSVIALIPTKYFKYYPEFISPYIIDFRDGELRSNSALSSQRFDYGS